MICGNHMTKRTVYQCWRSMGHDGVHVAVAAMGGVVVSMPIGLDGEIVPFDPYVLANLTPEISEAAEAWMIAHA